MAKRFSDASRVHPGWDYSGPGAYFITICTKHRKRYFGSFKESGQLVYSEIGEIKLGRKILRF